MKSNRKQSLSVLSSGSSLNGVVCRTGLLGLLVSCGGLAATSAGTVEIEIRGGNKEPLPCRIHLKDAAGKAQRAKGLPFWKDHFVCPGSVTLTLPAGDYSFEIERGPEYRPLAGLVAVSEAGMHKLELQLQRIADLAQKGWFSGDLHVHRRVEEIELHMRAENLHVAPVITWWNNRNLWADRQPPADPLVQFDGNRFYHLMAGEDEREGGALMYFRLKHPLAIAGSSREYPSPMKFLAEARRHKGVWVDIEKPFWWDVPVWLATGQIDSIGLANNHMCRSEVYASEAWGRPRDTERLPPPLGNGFWTQEIYYHILNCGLRIPPSAGSASGVLPNPVGYNRVYVHVGENLTEDGWWNGLKAGRSFVTNGPLLLCKANGQLPGHVFSAEEGAEIDINLDLALLGNDTVPAWEIIKNGRIEKRIPLADRSKSDCTETLTFRKSGWFLVRALADNKRTFRFASTAPYYVEVAPVKQRVSRRSAKFFLDWVDERAARVPEKLKDPEKLEEVLAHHRRAREFWQKKLDNANAE